MSEDGGGTERMCERESHETYAEDGWLVGWRGTDGVIGEAKGFFRDLTLSAGTSAA